MSDARKGLFDLGGKAALVTGAAGGLGQAIAMAFAEQGASLVLADRDEEAVEAVAARCQGLGVEAKALSADLSDPVQASELAADALAVHGRIDALVCNAGMQRPAAWHPSQRQAPLQDHKRQQP